MRRVFLLLLTLVLGATTVANADDLDDLFEDPAADIVEPEKPADTTAATAAQIDHTVALTTAERLIISGSVSSEGGIGLGWLDWPRLADPAFGWDGTMGAEASSQISLDARPDKTFRFKSTFAVDWDPLATGKYTWSAPTVSEIFLDYTWQETAFFRIGKHTIDWGKGRLFTDTDIMSESSGAFAARMSVPTLLSGFSAVVLAKDGWFAEPKAPSMTEPAYAALLEWTIAGVHVSGAAKYRTESAMAPATAGLSLLFSGKTVVLQTDLFSDIVYENRIAGDSVTVVVGFFREVGDFKSYGEYLFRRRPEKLDDHSAGIVFGWKRVFGAPLDVGVQWLHTLYDDSGVVIPGLSWRQWSHVEIKAAVQVAYGDVGSRYLTTENDDPAKRRVALAITAKLSGSF